MDDRDRAAIADEIECSIPFETFDSPDRSTGLLRPYQWWCDLIGALRAEERQAREWRPIATAPRDGTGIIVYSPEAEESFCVFTAHCLEGPPGEFDWYDVCEGPVDVTLTHWQPLPPPPRALPDEEPQP
jgi:hypothetical protein